MKIKKLVLGVTAGGSSRLLDGQAAYFKELGYEVFLISQDHIKEKIFCEKEGITHLPVDIVADIHLFKDLKSLFQIIRHFRKVKPDIVNLGTPKMGLLGMMAAFLLGINRRVYTCRGLRFETEAGIKRSILVALEKLTVKMSRKVIYVSMSLRKAALNYKVADSSKSIVIGQGSSNGVDIAYFKNSLINAEKRIELQESFKLQNCIVIGAVGRVTRDKGSHELVEVFEELCKVHNNIKLIFMGHIKCDPIFEARFRSNANIIHIPFQNDVPLYMSLFDILVHPSWREGFPNVPIQVAAMEVPVIISDATGCVDAVSNDYNGLIFKKKDKEELYSHLNIYINDKSKRIMHGKNGLIWANNFAPSIIWNGINTIYKSFL